MAPQISVVMPVYNVNEIWLKESIESILSQSFTDFEFLIVDDGSMDHTYTVCQRYAHEDSRIRLFQFANNRGIAAAMNYAIQEAKGKRIAIHDGDDISLPTRLETQYRFMESNPSVVLLGTRMELKFEENTTKPFRESALNFLTWYNACVGERIDTEFIKGSCIANGTAMYDKDHAIAAGLYNQHYEQLLDWEFFLRLKSFGDVAKCEETLYVYRRHGNSFCYNANAADQLSEIQVPYVNDLFPIGTKVALWGTGAGGLAFLRTYVKLPHKKMNLQMVIDGSERKVGDEIEGYRIQPPESLHQSGMEKVIIAVSISKFLPQIKSQLQDFGFSADQIYELFAPA